jgi:signal transduction histidine kinase
MDCARHPMEDLLARGRAQDSLTEDEASELCREAIAAASTMQEDRVAARALVALTREYMKFGRTAEAGLAVEAAIARFETPETEMWQGEAWAMLGAVRRHHGQHAEAAEIARKVIWIAQRIGDPVLEATGHNNLALTLHTLGNLDQALTNYLAALAVLEPVDTRDSQRLRMFMSTNVADLHSEGRDHLRAVEYHTVALELSERLDIPLMRLRVGRKRAGCLRKARRVDEAREQLQILVPLLSLSPALVTTSHQVRADLAHLDGDLAMASRLYRLVLEREGETASARARARMELDLACVLPVSDEEAFQLALSAWSYAREQEPGGGLCCDVLELLSSQHEARGDLVSALWCAREGAKFQQVLLEQARRREQSELQARLELSQRSWEARWHRAQAEELTRRVDERTRELMEARDRAQAADRMKVGFLAAASHELRTPLNAIIGYGEMIREELGLADPDELAEPADRLLESAERLLQLVDRILQLTNLEAGATRPTPTPVAVGPLLASVIEAVERRSRRKNQLTWSCLPELGAPCTDGTLLRSVLFNLVENADKFTTGGRVEVDARREGELLVISVQDTGIGMAPEELARLFQLFTQIESGFTRRFGGLGLGLALGRRYCQLLGGDLTVRSEAGRGSVFEIHIPFVFPKGGT